VNRTLTRRRFVAGAAGMAATVALPTTAAARRRRRRRTADVCIVGAGLAGLTAARNIARSGRDVIVLEARDRVGGRLQNKTIAPGVVTELGAEYVGPTQDRILALAKAVGADTFPTYNEGSNVLILDGQRSLYPASPGVSDDPQFLEAIATIPVLDQMAAEVPVVAPWKAARADEWDNQTLAQFRDEQIPSSGGRQVFNVASRAIWGAEAEQLSLLYALFYIASAGNPQTPGSLARLISTGGGAQDSRFVGGSQLVPINVAKRLGSHVVLEAPVRRIERSGSAVTVIADGNEVTAQRAIVAVPPVVALDIDYSPALPRAKSRLLRRIVPGNERKWAAIYDRPFWRDAGLSGQGVGGAGPADSTFDNTPPQGAPGILFGFVGGAGSAAAKGQGQPAHRAALTENLVAFYGEDARPLTGYIESRWSEERWTKGCPVGHTGRNVLATLGPQLRKPVGTIHFAGTETADYWFGYMDGAVRSGERAAREVLRSL
jgi:monoamine oxidase